MSGVEAITAIQLIDACIGIANTIIDIGRAVHDAQGLPPKLRDLLEKLPAIQELLESAQESCEEGSITEDASKSAQPILKQCEVALAELRDIFRKACPKDGENRTKRIWRGTKTVFFGRDSQAQRLLVTIQDNLRLLEQKEIYVIGDKLDALEQVTESLANEDGKYTHTGAGNIIANEGGSSTNYIVGGSNNRQINNPGVYNEGPSKRPETPPEPSINVPFPRDPDFVDHGTLLDQISKRCAAPASRVALVGLGGVGKSQLAIEHCYRTAEQSLDTWVFWAHASNTARLEQSFREIANQVRARGRKDPQADVFELVRDWLRNAKNGRWLLVLDNTDDAAIVSPTEGSSGLQQHLSRYLPFSRHGAVLVTSRTKSAAMQIVEDSDIILIEPMHDAAAHALLRKKLRDIDDKDDNIATLATTLSYMPLALVQAAAYIRERAPRCSVRQYLEEYRQSDHRKTRLLNQEAGHLRRDIAASNSILVTWQISFDHIRSTRQSAAGLLSLMSFFDRQGIQEALLHQQSSIADDGFEEDVLVLRDYSLITVTRDVDTFEMHSLVQLATRTWLENEGQLDKWRERFISNLCAELPTGEHENWEKCQALFPHARAALAQQPKSKESRKEWALLLYRAAWYAWRRGRAGEAEEMATMSMEVRSEELGEGDVRMIESMGMVGLARELGGKYKEAEAMHRQTLAQMEKVFGYGHLHTLSSMNNLALVLTSQGKYKEAEVMNRQTLALMEKVKHPDTLMSMNNLAHALESQGKYEEAEAMNRHTLVRREKVLGHEHPDTLLSMHNLAHVLDSQGKYKEAEAMNRQTLVRREKVLGYEHPDTLMSMNNLAHALESQGKYEEAEAMNRQTLVRREKVLGHEHPHTLLSMHNLAHVLDRQGKYEEAETINRQTLALREKVLGHEHPHTITSMGNLVGVLDSQSKYEEAETINRKRLVLMEKVLGYEHPDTLMSMHKLVLLLDRQGRYAEAEAINRQTLARREKVLGHEHLSTLTSVYCLANLLTHQHYYNEALALYKRACTGYETILGKAHSTTHACHQHYAYALASHKQHQLAIPPTTTDSSARAYAGKQSKLVRGLAKIGIRSPKSVR
ncbi:hypothetical protein PSV08DRAFT_358843 [Bipolaris maydis]|nr:hypothetical protein J3E73DRAFT_378670 [Bipolaris maydis]KAJ6274486.1 hypothetical protein PSV08DRAFT_358843 [Bipolaris maydis]